MWELDCKESWAPKNWCFWTVALEKTLESPLDCKEIKPVNPKGYQPWIFIERTEAEAPVLWPPDAKNWLIGKDPDAGKDWRQEEKGMTEDKMVGCYHWLNGHEFEQTLGVGDGQESLAWCSPWGRKESDMTEQLHWDVGVVVRKEKRGSEWGGTGRTGESPRPECLGIPTYSFFAESGWGPRLAPSSWCISVPLGPSFQPCFLCCPGCPSLSYVSQNPTYFSRSRSNVTPEKLSPSPHQH